MLVEKPEYVMKKTDIDWCPSINLAHKINVDSLQAANDRAEHIALQQKKDGGSYGQCCNC